MNKELSKLSNKFDIQELKYIQDILKAEQSLYEFFKQAWYVMEGNTPFQDSWLIQVISEHIEAVIYGKIKNLLINVPPRSLKTSILSIATPAWVWIKSPDKKFMYASYANSLSMEHSVKCRRLIESNWYQERWGYLYKLARDQNAKSFFENNQKGHRIATSILSAATGKGADFVIADDPNNVKDGESKVKKASTIMAFNQVLSTRLNDPQNGGRIVVQQRIAENDVSGDIIANDKSNIWTKLIIPLEYEESRKSRTIILPSTNGQVWEDPRTVEGEVICEKRWSPKVITRYKQELGAYGYAGQFQQRPAPFGGGLIKSTWFKWWKHPVPPNIEFTIQSWDTALTINDTSSYSACTTWGVYLDDNYIENIILLSMWKGRLEYPELRKMIKRLYFDYRDNGKIPNPKIYRGRPIDMCLIEAKASGIPLMQDLLSAGIRAIPFNPNRYKDDDRKSGGKIQRASLAAPLIEGGLVWLPAQPPNYDRLLPYADNFLNTIASFPSPESDDVMDTMSQALLKLKDGKYILNPRDERPIEESYRPIEVY